MVRHLFGWIRASAPDGEVNRHVRDRLIDTVIESIGERPAAIAGVQRFLEAQLDLDAAAQAGLVRHLDTGRLRAMFGNAAE